MRPQHSEYRTPGRFVKPRDQTSAYKVVIGALELLKDEQGHAMAERAFADWASVGRFASSLELPGGGSCELRVARCICPLMGKGRCRCSRTMEYDLPPGADHSYYLWERGAGPIAFVTQPYEIDMEALELLGPWCRERGLTAQVSSLLSWHYPGWTMAIIITRRVKE